MEKHWSKDFVEHLRAVHFALVIVCVGLIIIASFRTRSEISIAHMQIKQILELSRIWSEDFLQDAGRKFLAPKASQERHTTTLPFVLAIPMTSETDGKLFLAPQAPGENWFVTSDAISGSKAGNDDYGIVRISDRPAWTRMQRPNSIKEFRTLWDALDRPAILHFPISVGKCLYRYETNRSQTVVSPGHSHTEITISLPEDEPCMEPTAHSYPQDEVESAPLRLVDYGISTPGGKPHFRYALQVRYTEVGRRGAIILPIKSTDDIPIDAQSTLIDKMPGQQHGSYSDRFRELASIGESMQDANLDSAERIIAAEEKRSGEQFEAVGLKVPVEAAVRWGMILVIAVQLYFWIHLFEFRNRLGADDPGWEVAWVGVYDSMPARCIMWLSLGLLPCSTVFVLGLHGLSAANYRWIPWLILVGTIVVSLTLSILTLICVPRRTPSITERPGQEVSAELE